MKNKIKVEIGQEWVKHVGIEKIEKITVIINDNNKYGSDYKYGYAEGFSLESGYLMMKIENGYPKYDHWEYLGTPVKCEDCKKFCKQECHYKWLNYDE